MRAPLGTHLSGHPAETDAELPRQVAPSGDTETGDTPAASGAVPLATFIAEELAQEVLTDVAAYAEPARLNEPAGRVALVPLYDRVVTRLEQAGLGGADALAPNDLDTLRLVSLLFEAMLADEQVSDPMRFLLVCLQLPTLRVALDDPSFFDDDNHAARRFLNLLAEIGIGWSSDASGPHESRTYEMLRDLVREVTDHIFEDPGHFAVALERLQQLRKDHSVRAQRAENRLIELESGKAKVKAAKLAVQHAVNRLLRTVEPPRIVRQFAADSWSKVLVYLCIRFGPEAPQWQEALGLLHDIFAYSKPASSDQETARRELDIPHLLERLERQMAFAGIPEAETQRQSFALYECFRRVLEQDREWFESEGAYVVDGEDVEEIILVAEPSPVTPSSSPNMAAALAAIEPGVWLQVSDPEDPAVDLRYKVSALFADTGDLLLVDERGVKAAEWDRSELARRLEDGRVRILDGQHLIERAIDTLMAELREWQLDG